MKTCKICGFTWSEGHGAHDCGQTKDARYEALLGLFERYPAGKHDAQHVIPHQALVAALQRHS